MRLLRAFALLATLGAAALAGPAGYQGRALGEALQALSARGLRLVFSSEVVTPEMRVVREPRATTPPAIARELVAPHGLELRRGPDGVWQVVRKKRDAGSHQPQASAGGDLPSGEPARFRERIDVSATPGDGGVGPEALPLSSRDVTALAGAAENPFRALQALPGVAATDDFDSRLAVRGGGPDENLTVWDGVEIHNPYRLHGLVSAFNPETVQRFDLSTGGFDVRHGDRLSSLLVIESRDGTEAEKLRGAASLSLSDANLVLEGRLPRRDSGSWLVAARRTYFDLVADRFLDSELPSMQDVEARLRLQPRPDMSLRLFGALSSETTRYQVFTAPAANSLGEDYRIFSDGKNALAGLELGAGFAGARLRSVLACTRFSDATDFHGRIETDARGANIVGSPDSRLVDVLYAREARVRDFSLRSELAFAAKGRHRVVAGFEAHALEASWGWDVGGATLEGFRNFARLPYPSGLPAAGLPATLRSTQASGRWAAWSQDTLTLASRLQAQAGLRVDHSGANSLTALSPRAALSFAAGSAWRLRAGAGLYRQSPGYEKLFQADYFVDQSAVAALQDERALHIVSGVEWLPRAGVTLRVEGYWKSFQRLLLGRLETEAERALRVARYDFPSALAGEVPRAPQVTSVATNEGAGRAWGFDVYASRRQASHATRVWGWAAYSFGQARREAYGRTFPFDYDRPHAVTAVAQARLIKSLDLAATTRIASGFPRTAASSVRVAAEVDAEDRDRDGNRSELRPKGDGRGSYVYELDYGDVSKISNARLPAFARLDLRVTYRPYGDGGRWTFYIDVINVLDRANAGRINAVVERDLSQRRPVVREEPAMALPRLPSLGVRLRF